MTKTLEALNELNNKKVLFITTKSPGYIRNAQEIRLLKESAASPDIVGSYGKNYFLRLVGIYPKLMFMSYKGYDAVLVGFAPQLVIPLFGRRMRRAGCLIAEDFFISLFDTFCNDRKKFGADSFMGRFLHRLDEKTLAAADMVICDTKAHAGYFAKEFNVSVEKEKVLYITADKEIFHPLGLDRTKTLKKYFPDADIGSSEDETKEKSVVMYFGSVLPLQGIDTVVSSMKKLAETGRYICIFVGPLTNAGSTGEDPHAKIYCKDWLSEDELAELIDISDVCLAGHFNAEIEKAKRTIPGKAFVYEAMNKPMVLGDNEANREYFPGSDRVEFADMGDPEAVVEAVERLIKGENAE